MKKTALLITALFAVTAIVFAQNQTVNGNLHVSNTSGGSLRIGKIGDLGNKAVPIGGLAAQYNLDFTGYRDVTSDQIGARIAALRFNKYEENNALVQKTGLAFYTNDNGWVSGEDGLVEQMRITPEGNVGIGTSTPDGVAKLDVKGRIYAEEYSIEKNVPALMYAYWDMFTHGGRKLGHYSIGWYDDPSFVYAPTLKMTAWGGIKLFTEGQERVSILHNGNVGIGTENPTEKLDVAGTIRAKEVKIEATGWSDFVFDKNYDLPKLSDVEKHINDNRHLPGIPSEKEVLENGVNVVDMQAKLLQKIEELTLYVIEQDKQNKELQSQLKKQNERIQQLENR